MLHFLEGYCFFNQFDNLCLLIWMFRPFIMIIDNSYKSCYLYSVFLICSWFLQSSFFLCLNLWDAFYLFYLFWFTRYSLFCYFSGCFRVCSIYLTQSSLPSSALYHFMWYENLVIVYFNFSSFDLCAIAIHLAFCLLHTPHYIIISV